jgi:hypothetical protein
MATAALSLVAAQAAVEYVLIAGRGVMQFLARVAGKIVALVGTPRGVLIGGACVLLLAFMVGRRPRR